MMQTTSVGHFSIAYNPKKAGGLPQFRGGGADTALKTGIADDRPHAQAGVDELNPLCPIGTVNLQPESEALEKQAQAQQAQVQGLLSGLSQGAEVIFQNGAWRKNFSESKALQGGKENIFDQLSSVWNLAVARFREAYPLQKETPAIDVVTPEKGTTAVKPAEPQPSTSSSVPEKPLLEPNLEAFGHYQKVVLKYPDLALKQEELPFDLGAQAASVAQNSEKMKADLARFRNQKLALTQKIQKQIAAKKLKGEAAQAHTAAVLKAEYPAILSSVKTMFTPPKTEHQPG